MKRIFTVIGLLIVAILFSACCGEDKTTNEIPYFYYADDDDTADAGTADDDDTTDDDDAVADDDDTADDDDDLESLVPEGKIAILDEEKKTFIISRDVLPKGMEKVLVIGEFEGNPSGDDCNSWYYASCGERLVEAWILDTGDFMLDLMEMVELKGKYLARFTIIGIDENGVTHKPKFFDINGLFLEIISGVGYNFRVATFGDHIISCGTKSSYQKICCDFPPIGTKDSPAYQRKDITDCYCLHYPDEDICEED